MVHEIVEDAGTADCVGVGRPKSRFGGLRCAKRRGGAARARAR